MGFDYDTEDGIIYAALRISHTIIPDVLDGKEFWLLLIFNLVIGTLRKLDMISPGEIHVDLPWHLTGVTGSLMTFFVCFYNQHQFGRYNQLYDVTQSLCEEVLEVCAKLKVEIPDRRIHRKVSKLVTASIFMFFYERSGRGAAGRTGDEGQVTKEEYGQLWHLQLLDEDEIKALKSHCRRMRGDSVAAFLLLQWVMELIMSHTDDPPSREDMLAGFIGKVYKIRTCQAIVTQIMELPMPFQYFHIMNFMLMLNLVLWAYSLACQDSWFAPFIYMFVQMMFQGIRELSTSLADPFGQDDVDFAINDWLTTLYVRVHSIIEDDFVPDKESKDGNRMLEIGQAIERINAHVDFQESMAEE